MHHLLVWPMRHCKTNAMRTVQTTVKIVDFITDYILNHSTFTAFDSKPTTYYRHTYDTYEHAYLLDIYSRKGHCVVCHIEIFARHTLYGWPSIEYKTKKTLLSIAMDAICFCYIYIYYYYYYYCIRESEPCQFCLG